MPENIQVSERDLLSNDFLLIQGETSDSKERGSGDPVAGAVQCRPETSGPPGGPSTAAEEAVVGQEVKSTTGRQPPLIPALP